LQGLTVALSTLISNIDTNNLYEESKSVFETVVENNDYLGLLKVYNRKSIPSQISKHLGLSGGGLAELVVRLACGSKTEEITLALKPYFGNFQNNMA
jgi:hypothetical protein